MRSTVVLRPIWEALVGPGRVLDTLDRPITHVQEMSTTFTLRGDEFDTTDLSLISDDYIGHRGRQRRSRRHARPLRAHPAHRAGRAEDAGVQLDAAADVLVAQPAADSRVRDRQHRRIRCFDRTSPPFPPRRCGGWSRPLLHTPRTRRRRRRPPPRPAVERRQTRRRCRTVVGPEVESGVPHCANLRRSVTRRAPHACGRRRPPRSRLIARRRRRRYVGAIEPDMQISDWWFSATHSPLRTETLLAIAVVVLLVAARRAASQPPRAPTRCRPDPLDHRAARPGARHRRGSGGRRGGRPVCARDLRRRARHRRRAHRAGPARRHLPARAPAREGLRDRARHRRPGAVLPHRPGGAARHARHQPRVADRHLGGADRDRRARAAGRPRQHHQRPGAARPRNRFGPTTGCASAPSRGRWSRPAGARPRSVRATTR